MAILVVGCVPRGLVFLAIVAVLAGATIVVTGGDQTIARALLVNGMLSAIAYLVIERRERRP